MELPERVTCPHGSNGHQAQLDPSGRRYNCPICETTVSLKAAGVLQSEFAQIVSSIDLTVSPPASDLTEITLMLEGDPESVIFYDPKTGVQGVRSLHR